MRADLFVGGVGCLSGLPFLCAARVAVVVWYGYIVHYGTLYVKTFCYCRTYIIQRYCMILCHCYK